MVSFQRGIILMVEFIVECFIGAILFAVLCGGCFGLILTILLKKGEEDEERKKTR